MRHYAVRFPNSDSPPAEQEAQGLSRSIKNARTPTARGLAWIFIVIMVVQSYLAPLIALASAGNHDRYMSLYYVHATVAYSVIVTAILVFGERRLPVLHDHLSAWTIVVSCLTAGTLSRAGVLSGVLLAALAMLLAAHIVANRTRFKRVTLKSVGQAVLWAGATVLAIALLRTLLQPIHGTLPPAVGQYMLGELVFQMPLVAVVEESYSRGLLYCLLILVGMDEKRALLLQAGLFFGSHYLVLMADPLLFVVLVPVATILLSNAVRRTGALYVPILMHTANNVLGGIAATILSGLLQ